MMQKFSRWFMEQFNKMEIDKRQKKMKRIHIDLPKLQTSHPIRRSASKQNASNAIANDLSPKMKNLRKLFFQYRSNARILENSPYYINSSKGRQKFVEMISTKRYDMSAQVEEEIQVRYGWKEEGAGANTEDSKAKKELSVKLHYDDRVYALKIECHTSEELTKKMTVQLARVMFSLKNTFMKCDLLLCFQTVEQNHEIDFILSNPKLEIGFLPQLNLSPVFSSKNTTHGKKVSLNDFKFIKCLGNGGFSTVFLVRGNFDNKYYALKLISKDFIVDSSREGIVQNERYILGELNFPLVTQLEFAFETKNHFALVIEYCPGGELFYQLKRVKRMKEEEAKFYFLQILVGLDYIHSKNIIYRDLKPENLLIGIDGHLKIADFGLSKPLTARKEMSHSFCGSPEYMAPEMLLKYNLCYHRTGHNHMLDYYCLGALLYELVVGVPPYYSLEHQEIYQSILNEELSFPPHVQLSEQLMSLLRGLLEKNSKKRLGCMFGIKEILLHPWVGKVKQKAIENKELQPPFMPNLEAFNFDITDIKTDQQAISKKVEEDLQCKDKFETFFSDEFYFQSKPYQEKVQQLTKRKTECKSRSKKTLKKSRSVQNCMLMTNRTSASIRGTFIESLKPATFATKLPSQNITSRQLSKVKSSKLFNITLRK